MSGLGWVVKRLGLVILGQGHVGFRQLGQEREAVFPGRIGSDSNTRSFLFNLGNCCNLLKGGEPEWVFQRSLRELGTYIQWEFGTSLPPFGTYLPPTSLGLVASTILSSLVPDSISGAAVMEKHHLDHGESSGGHTGWWHSGSYDK